MTDEYLKRGWRIVALCSNTDSKRMRSLKKLGYSHLSAVRHLKILGLRLF
jgi:hypothetical protein